MMQACRVGSLRRLPARGNGMQLQQRFSSCVPATPTCSNMSSFQRHRSIMEVPHCRRRFFAAQAPAPATGNSASCQENLVKEAIKKMMLERHEHHDDESKAITDDELELRFRSFDVRF